MRRSLLLLPLIAGCLALAQNAPEAEISNGAVRAKLYLPDAERGYYRGSRFDWSGVIASLEYKGHNFFGVWFPKYDPRLHDAITGPVEEFRTEDGGIGFSAASAGGTFLKVGIGMLRKPDDKPYAFVRPYEIVNGGQWVVRPSADRVEFVQTLNDDTGYRYEYRKTVRLDGKKPRLIIEHTLINKGRQPLKTSVYNHDFYVIDDKPTGPGVTVKFPFAVRATQPLNDLAEVKDHEIVYKKELQKGQSAASYLEGYGTTAKDYDIRVENTEAGVGVRQTGDRPISKLYLWSIRTTVCPEAYIDLDVAPGKSTKWRIAYDFYTLPEKGTK
jgi:hypothetical protein